MIDDILRKFRNVKQNGNGYHAECPAHASTNKASLSITTADDGKVLLHCFAGCTVEEIVSAAGLSMSDLFPDGRGEGGVYPGNKRAHLHTPPKNTAKSSDQGVQGAFAQQCTGAHPCNGCTLQEYAEVKRIPEAVLRSFGLSDITYMQSPVVRIPYLDLDGKESAVRFRTSLTGKDRFRWRKGSKPFLYGLSRLNGDRPDSLVLVEGESDCHTLWHMGIPALGIPGASNWKEDRDAHHFDGISTIYIVVEPDRGGEAVRKWLSRSRIRDRVRLISLGQHKDPSGLYLADPDQFLTRWREAIDASVPWSEIEVEETAKERGAAWEQCESLATMPSILDEFEKDIRRAGVVGEERTVKIIYLAVTSRFLDRPLSVVVKGPSSAGKSYAVEQVLSFFPESAFYALSGMSEKALAYSEEPLSHRMLVIYEAAGMNSEFATYLMRSLLSEGRIRYELVEKTKDGIKPRIIEREGPTGLIVTTTQLKLHPENETRMFSLPVTDTQDQTKGVLLSLAAESPKGAGRDRWTALQTWLDGANHEVIIPFAVPLADLIPPVAVRLRRDFKAVLNLIKAHAILHQASRKRDAAGRIIAEIDDYAVVRELVEELVAEGIEVGIPATTRETVDAVEKLLAGGEGSSTSIGKVAAELKLDRSAAHRRVKSAIAKGYLKNLEDRKGKPAMIAMGDPMPKNLDVLPMPEAVQGCAGVQGCANVDCTGAQHEEPQSEPVCEGVCSCASETEGVNTPPPPPPTEEDVMVACGECSNLIGRFCRLQRGSWNGYSGQDPDAVHPCSGFQIGGASCQH